ncbi:hypothetical protein C6W18_15260, partial [Bacillus sp. LLTC93]
NEWYLAHLTGRPIRSSKESIFQQRGWCPLGRETAIQKLEWKDHLTYWISRGYRWIKCHDAS